MSSSILFLLMCSFAIYITAITCAWRTAPRAFSPRTGCRRSSSRWRGACAEFACASGVQSSTQLSGRP
ncbi:hypothetical protein BJX64DRAFT_273076 [Aspergillus heterothallicus]